MEPVTARGFTPSLGMTQGALESLMLYPARIEFEITALELKHSLSGSSSIYFFLAYVIFPVLRCTLGFRSHIAVGGVYQYPCRHSTQDEKGGEQLS